MVFDRDCDRDRLDSKPRQFNLTTGKLNRDRDRDRDKNRDSFKTAIRGMVEIKSYISLHSMTLWQNLHIYGLSTLQCPSILFVFFKRVTVKFMLSPPPPI